MINEQNKPEDKPVDTEFDFIGIPHFDLSEEEQRELRKELIASVESSKTDNVELYESIKRIREYKKCRNSKSDRIKRLVSEDDTGNSSPNLHLPDLKNNGNIGTAEIKDALFSGDYLEWKAADPKCNEDEKMVKKIFESIMKQTDTDYQQTKIIDNIWYEGTCPVIIRNNGRVNATHEILYKNEIALEPENIDAIVQYLVQKIGVDETAAIHLFSSVQPVLYYKNKIEDGESVTDIYLENDFIIDTVFEDDEFIKTEAILTQVFGLNLSKVKTEAAGIKTIETWVEGLPRPEILDILHTFIEPCEANNNPETYKVVNESKKKTMDLFDNPNFMNRDKLKENDEFVGTHEVKKDSGDTDTKQTTKEKVCTFLTGYFESYKFKCGKKRTLRNFIASAAAEMKDGLLECKPNMSYAMINGTKISQNPFIVFTYYETSDSNLGTCPALDIIDLTRINNILYNYGLETLATIGNKYVMDASLNFDTTSGGVGTIFTADLLSNRMKQAGIKSVKDLFQEIPTDPTPVQLAMNQIPTMRDYMNQSSNTSASYFGQKNQQTATEINTVVNQASGIVRTVIVQVSKKLCDLYLRMWEDAVNKGVTIEIMDEEQSEDKKKMSLVKSIDLSTFKGKKFMPVITSVTPNLSKQVIAQKLTELLTNAFQSGHPELMSRFNVSEIAEYIISSFGIDQPNLTRNDDEAKTWILENDEKEQIYEQIKSGQFQLVPAMQPNEEQSGNNVLPADDVNPIPIEQAGDGVGA